MQLNFFVRNASPSEFYTIGKIMVEVYSQLEGFPSPEDQPAYYKMLANIGELTKKAHTELIVAVDENGKIAGAVVYFSDMNQYGSGGTATSIKNSSGFRLLAVDPSERGKGIGKLLCEACITRARNKNQKQIIIHSTESMKIAWKMYVKLGFKRFKEIDFMQEKLPVFGFKLNL